MNLFDLHCDTPSALFKGLKPAVSFTDKIQKQVQICAVFVRDDKPYPNNYYKAVLNDLKHKLNYPINDLSAEKLVILAVEGGAVLEGKTERVKELFSDGVSVLSLAWNGETELAGGVNTDKGLTQSGKAVIAEMNRLGMVLDLSHLNDKSFYKAVDLSNLPIATHSNSRSVCNHKRNLTDEQLRLLKEKGGLIGINFYPKFLGTENVFDNIYNHISYMLDLGLINNIAIGSDFDGAEMSTELDCTEKTLLLYEHLEKKRLNMDILDKIFYENAMNFFKNVFDIRALML